MPGPAPKDPKLRQRRNKQPTAGALPPGKKALSFDTKGKPKRPALPNRGKGNAWHPRTKQWWEHVWSSPMATQYLETDLDGLLALAELVDARYTATSMTMRLSIESEIRMQSKLYGLTPMDRRSLGWTIADEEDEGAEDDQPEPEQDAEDPRKVLRMPGA